MLLNQNAFSDYCSASPEARDLCEPFLVDSQARNDPDEVYRLEQRSQTTKLLRSLYTPVDSNVAKYVLRSADLDLPKPQHLGSQFARRLYPIFTKQDRSESRAAFRSLNPGTIDEATVSETTDDQFEYLYDELQCFLGSNDQDIHRVVLERFTTDTSNGHENRSAYVNNDRYQFNARQSNRSLDSILSAGIEISVDQNGVGVLKKAIEENESDPSATIDQVKNWPILTINGFNGSKLSLAIHDVFDHGWTYAAVARLGLFDKYRSMFTSIGSPHQTDIFKREGEILASISFGMRYWENQENFIPIINSQMARSIFNMYYNAGKLEMRHMDAYNTIRRLADDTSSESQSLGFVLSNYIATLHEQRRRYGKIWQKHPNSDQIAGELNPLSPDFLSLLIDLHSHLFNPNSGYWDNLNAAHVLIENFLYGVGCSRYSPDHVLRMNIESLVNNDTSDLEIPYDRLQWMADYPRFSSIKERVV